MSGRDERRRDKEFMDMRIYQGLHEAYHEIERDLNEMGTVVRLDTYQDKDIKGDPKFVTKEIQGYSYMITSFLGLEDNFLTLGGNSDYAEQELSDRVNQEYLNPGYSWKHRDKVWNKLLKSMVVLPCGEKSIRLRPHLTFSKEDADIATVFIKNAI